MGPSPTELNLLLACARPPPIESDAAAIRQMLATGIDWTSFMRKAVDHGVAGLVTRTLVHAAPGMVPDGIRNALPEIIAETRKKNDQVLDELARVIETLEARRIEAIPFKEPIPVIEAHGDAGLRASAGIELLIRDVDVLAATTALRGAGYDRTETLTDAQLELIQRLQGRSVLVNHAAELNIKLHTRLAPANIVLGIDYPGLRRRVQRTVLHGRATQTLAPEDNLLALAIQGSIELWWNIQSACDVAAFIGAHPALDWGALVERARDQGCLRMVLLAASLAQKHFAAPVPEAIAARARADPAIAAARGRILARWQADEPPRAPGNRTVSLDRLRLHDGAPAKARYVARTWLLPGPHHVAAMPLPRHLHFAYVPIKLAHDGVALPLWRTYRWMRGQAARLRDAVATSDAALAIRPASPERKQTIRRSRTACVEARRKLAANPTDTAAWCNLANALSELGRYRQAIACYDRALDLVPDNRDIWQDRTGAFRAGNRNGALADLDAENLPASHDAAAWVRRAGRLSAERRYSEAAAASDRALAANPQDLVAQRIGIRSRIFACDWHRRDDDKRQVAEGLRAGLNIIRPLNYRLIGDSESDDLLAAQLFAAQVRQPQVPLWQGATYRHERIRLAYVSPDFGESPTANVSAGIYEHHDRARFETFAISLRPNDSSRIRRRIEAAFAHFIDVDGMTDAAVATMMREIEIDIAIELVGHAAGNRPGILACRPAPVQVNYLNAGTMGAGWIDYVIADRIAIPEASFRHYTEQVVHLPNSFFSSDSRRHLPQSTPSRAEAGLPDAGFVFGCFCSHNRIAPDVFDVWMRLLVACPDSVLWLARGNPDSVRNLRREATAREVAADRLIFAPRVPSTDDHLARIRAADLFLDTRPYGAHATASDALWVGLPLLTCVGNGLSGRKAASQLHAVGLPELVTSSLAEYEALALALARDPERLAAIRTKLVRNRSTAPLFDSARFTRDLETAYTGMWERQQAGLPPAAIVVAG